MAPGTDRSQLCMQMKEDPVPMVVEPFNGARQVARHKWNRHSAES